MTAGGVGLVAYFALRIGLQTWARKNYVAPLRSVWPVGSSGPGNLDHAWNIVSGPSDRAGHLLPQPVVDHVRALCNGSAQRDPLSCMRAHHVFNLAVYQPASRFWLLQGVEAAIFVGLAAALLVTAVWWMRNRLS